MEYHCRRIGVVIVLFGPEILLLLGIGLIIGGIMSIVAAILGADTDRADFGNGGSGEWSP
ncbi:hypothetical protein LEP1GSC171_2069 [Leptospira santarosai str. HAI1380]|nr:hypothetical protein LEP1GSC171_2069 [Leptospira santarosai str. HAI1380]